MLSLYLVFSNLPYVNIFTFTQKIVLWLSSYTNPPS